MRRKIVAGNWKMNTNYEKAKALATNISSGVGESEKIVILFPPSIYLESVKKNVSKLKVGAQNIYFEKDGAYTGELSVSQAKDFAEYVLVGHSERRHVFGETNDDVSKKTKAILGEGLTPIVCVGETEQEKDKNQTIEVIRQQILAVFGDLNEEEAEKLVVAYEPVWAIGTGKVCDLETAEEVTKIIRTTIDANYNNQTGQEIEVLYGGSVKPDNSTDFMKSENIDGVLVGGASLSSEDFLKIINS